MEQFKIELRQLLQRYPQVKSVSFDVTETITAQGNVNPNAIWGGSATITMPPLGSVSGSAAVEQAIATLKIKPNETPKN